nr:retrovirus-related Pol polyprotein from transposon TNT 1-94 [Tanacetum cinerariifolium]
GVAERKNRTLIEAARTMLADSFLPTIFWIEAVNTASYVLNRVLVTKPQNKTPYELLTGRQPIISYLRPFGFHVTILNSIDQLGKFDGKCDLGPKEANNRAGTQVNDDQGANSEEIDLYDKHFVLPIWSAYSTIVKSLGDKLEKTTDFKTCEMPVSQVEQIFLEELKKLKRQEKEANDAPRKETTHENQDANTNSTNLLNAISTPISTVGPSRALNDGETSYPDDHSMPHLEDIYASPSEGIFTDSSYDDEGVVIDFNNLETTGVVVRNKARLVTQGHRQEEGIEYDKVSAPVARIEAIRIFLAFASYMGFIVYEMDVKTAFLYRTIDEEVYVTQPPGFVDSKFPNKVYKVMKTLYGLHQAPRACVKTASTPIETQKPLVKDKEADDVDVYLYRSMIGSLMYLTASRPGIMFVLCACSRFQTIMAASTTEAEYVAATHCCGQVL